MKKKINPAIPLAPSPSDTRAAPLHEEIATQAYILWQHYGQPSGQDLGIWLEAERNVLGTDKQASPQSAGNAGDARNYRPAFAAPLPATPTTEADRLTRERP